MVFPLAVCGQRFKRCGKSHETLPNAHNGVLIDFNCDPASGPMFRMVEWRLYKSLREDKANARAQVRCSFGIRAVGRLISIRPLRKKLKKPDTRSCRS